MENEIIQVSGSEMLEALNRSEIDMQIATAHKLPRDIGKCKQNMIWTIAWPTIASITWSEPTRTGKRQ